MESLALAEPGVRRIVVATDGPIPQLAGKAEVIAAESLGAPLKAMSVYYDALELNTAVKPFVFKRLLTEPGVTSATYLDPDICVYRPLDAVRQGLAEGELVLTPHTTRPLLGEANPNDRDLLRAGTYNLGFASMRNAAKPIALLEWWAERCRYDCRVDLDNGLFTDQKWMDLSPGFVDSVSLIRDPGLNLAYWNIEGRNLVRTQDGWTIDGRPLVFFHFSGFDPNRPRILSKHQNRVSVTPGSPLEGLLADFAAAMLRNGHNETSVIPYAHNRFASGRLVTPAMRRTALAAARADADFSAGLDDACEAWFDAPSPDTIAPGLPDLTRLMDAIWRTAPAAGSFDRSDSESRFAFHRWFADNAEALGVDAASVAAAQRLSAAAEASRTSDATVWRDAPWTGPASGALAWLREPASDGPPRAVAAVLAARQDLRRRFERDPDEAFAWCLGPEAAGGRFALDLLPDAALADLSKDPAPLYAAAKAADTALQVSDLRRRLFGPFGLSEKALWPTSLTAPLRGPWLGPAEGLPAPYIRLFAAIHEARTDLQRLYPLKTALLRLRFLRWLLAGGLAEYGVALEALPANVRNHPVMQLARISVRRRPGPSRTPTVGECAHLVVTERAPANLHLPANSALYVAAAGRFLDSVGHARPAPQRARCVYFLTDPDLVPADAIALHARGVAWARACGVWSPGEAEGRNSHGFSFVDEIWSTRPLADVPRRSMTLDASHPLHAALAELITPP